MLIVVGSRRDGNSLSLANYIKKELERDRIYSKIIVPGNQRINLCTGCMDCDESGVCDFNDDMKGNIEDVKKEEVIMFITPTRWNLLSGDIKIFMDRLNPLYTRGTLVGKKGIAISIGAKKKDMYSSYASTESLRNFMESSGMDCILTKNFDDCKEATEIEEKINELEDFIRELKNVL